MRNRDKIRLKRIRGGWYETQDGSWRAMRIDDPTHEGYGSWTLDGYDRDGVSLADHWPTLAHCRVVIEQSERSGR